MDLPGEILATAVFHSFFALDRLDHQAHNPSIVCLASRIPSPS